MTLRSSATPAFVATCIVIADQAVKVVVMRELGPNATTHQRWLLEDRLGFWYGENTGVAFGMLRSAPTLLIALVTVGVIAAICFFAMARTDNQLVRLAAAIVAGGASGNLLDRVRLGYVRDFISVGPWPPFNIADSAITIGVSLALFAMYQSEFLKTPVEPLEKQRGTEKQTMIVGNGK